MLSFIRFAAVPVVLLSAVVWAQAQWPLGREMPQVGAKSDEQHGPNVTVTGRFQIFVSPQAKGYTFMLDTDTGKIWVLKKDSASGDFSMQRIPVEQVDGVQTGKAPSKTTESGKSETSRGN
ncbi:MAG: hypothetical protein HY913_11240 [Desulfomonile tiedjei]|nr:hypothetical protein [Desulfomonile tiedjei]